jgi:sn-glycerol 3-phosphate transport system ATP-binding protein
MSSILLDRVSKSWGTTTALGDVSLSAEEGRLLVLLGPSGCGKSTALRLIAGLEEPTSGRILIADKDVTHLSPSQRAISMVFQSYALFPHLNVRENILFGLKVRKVPAEEREKRLQRVAGLVGLAGLLDRKPAQLSGGQRQRVALARAIISENPICLMDEPLSNLDAKLRHEMRIEIKALQRRLGITLVYVTHDQIEAMSMADKVVLLRDGKVEQVGTPAELYDRPATVFAASFIGTPPMNIIDLDTLSADVRGTAALARFAAHRRIGIRPEVISLAGDGVPATIRSIEYLGADTIVTADLGGCEVAVRVPGHMSGAPGERLGLSWHCNDVHVFDRDNRRTDFGPAATAVRTRETRSGAAHAETQST